MQRLSNWFNSVSAPTTDVELGDAITYMNLSNESSLTRNPLGAVLYLEEKIENTTLGKNPIVYHSNSWKEMLFKDYTMNQKAKLSVSGRGGVVQYYVSGSYNTYMVYLT